MISIKCVNPEFIEAPHTFDWDETPYGGVVTPDVPEARRIIAYCKVCAYENPVWVKKIPTSNPIYRGGKKHEQ
ncbi:MAG TPA: hypothetical protein VFD70_04760 [Anaerolineae bacterium]|nr:hypothetical protein [Anaerolineae bacterium]